MQTCREATVLFSNGAGPLHPMAMQQFLGVSENRGYPQNGMFQMAMERERYIYIWKLVITRDFRGTYWVPPFSLHHLPY